MHQPLKTFIIYAREDSATLVELKKSLNPFERKGQIAVWYDGEIIAGQEWKEVIKTQLETADLILLLLSSDFFDSEYIQKRELREALARHERGESIVIPVIVRHCLWQEHPEIEKLQVLPDNAMPITSKKHWDSPDEAFTNVAAGIARTVRRIHDQRETSNATELAEKQRLTAEAERAKQAVETQRQAEASAREEAARRARAEVEQREQAAKAAAAKRLKREQEAARRVERPLIPWVRYAVSAGPIALLAALIFAGTFLIEYMGEPSNDQLQVIENQSDTARVETQQRPDPNTQKEPDKTDTLYTPPAPILGPGSRKSGLTMVQVPGGTFQMGSNEFGDERPVHAVTLSVFEIGKYEVTQADWRDIMGSSPSGFKDCDLCPVEKVSWNDIQGFLKKLNAKYPGKNYRLLTEAEWEYAARGGNQSKDYKFSGSDNIGLVAWYDGNSGRKTHPVGERNMNEVGIYDMTGNVWEWCADWKDSYQLGNQNNPKGPNMGADRVCRGGCWYSGLWYCRTTFRLNVAPAFRGSGLGFRLGRSL